jgi:hypothetical protein
MNRTSPSSMTLAQLKQHVVGDGRLDLEDATPSSLAMTLANVDLPTPEGPTSSTWSSGWPLRGAGVDQPAQQAPRALLADHLVQPARPQRVRRPFRRCDGRWKSGGRRRGRRFSYGQRRGHDGAP